MTVFLVWERRHSGDRLNGLVEICATEDLAAKRVEYWHTKCPKSAEFYYESWLVLEADEGEDE